MMKIQSSLLERALLKNEIDSLWKGDKHIYNKSLYCHFPFFHTTNTNK